MRQGWQSKSLVEITSKIGSGATPLGGEKAYESFGIPLIRSLNVYDNGFRMKDLAYLNIHQASKLNNVTVESGDVLLNITGASVARCCIVPDELVPARVNQHVSIIRLKQAFMIPKFLYYSLTSFDSKTRLLNTGEKGGSTRQALTKSQLENFLVDFPPLPEQHLIVAILDEVFDSINRAKNIAERNLRNARELFVSYLQDVFNNNDWVEWPLENLCVEIFAGGDAPKKNFSSEKTDKYQIPILANAVADNGLYGYTNIARVTQPSISVAARGSGTGHTEIRNEPFFPIVRLIVLIPDSSLIKLEFLKHAIDNLVIVRSGSAIPQLTVPMIKEYKIPLPSMSEQISIVGKLAALQIKINQLEENYRREIKNLEELKKSVLQKAFNGVLTS